MSVDTLQQHETLVQALLSPGRWPEGGAKRQRIDTHISSVILAGDYAFKLKKPVDFGFLNFLSLEARRHWCEEELRLNRRTAPHIYLEVVPVTGTLQTPHLGGTGEVLDWAVKMRRFDPDALLARQPAALNRDLVTELADRIAQLHDQAALSEEPAFGTPQTVLAPMRQNFIQLAKQGIDDPTLQALNAWTERRFTELGPLLAQRHTGHRIRECHGDLHLGNIALIDGQPVIFDAIEFNPELRWIDPISDIAFLAMDLYHHQRSELVSGLLDRYLAHTGDYAALPLLGFYAVYRALVRAKVAALQLDQEGARREVLLQQIREYLALAERLARPVDSALLITHGPSGSGKSTQTAELPWQLPIIRVRSDLERKRLLELPSDQDASDHGGYSQQMTERTYQRLAECAQAICAAGFIPLVDATFLQAGKRAVFRQLADRLGLPFLIIDFDAPAEILRQRICQRQGAPENVSDAGLEVLRQQLLQRDPLSEQELEYSLHFRPDHPLRLAELQRRLATRHGT